MATEVAQRIDLACLRRSLRSSAFPTIGARGRGLRVRLRAAAGGRSGSADGGVAELLEEDALHADIGVECIPSQSASDLVNFDLRELRGS